MIRWILTASTCAFIAGPACASKGRVRSPLSSESSRAESEKPEPVKDIDGDGRPDTAPPEPNEQPEPTPPRR